MKTLEDLLDGADYGDDVAFGAPGQSEQIYTYDQLRETVYGFANVLEEQGLTTGSRIAISDGQGPFPALVFLSAAVLGNAAWIGAPQRVKAHAVVAPSQHVNEYTLPDGALRVGYGSTPDSDDVVHFERAVYRADGESPAIGVLPGTKVITDGEWQYSHRNLLNAGREIADRLDAETTVAVRAPLSDPRTVAGAVVAPMLVGGSVRFPDDADTAGDVAITDDTAPEPRAIHVDTIPLD